MVVTVKFSHLPWINLNCCDTKSVLVNSKKYVVSLKMNVTVISYFFPGGHDVDALDEDEDEPDDEDDDAEPRDHAHDQDHGGNEAEMSIDVCCLLSSQEAN